jgi:hypothetical protein
LHGDIKTATQHLHYLAEESPKHNSFEDLTEIGHFGSINNVNEEEEEEEREDIISSTLPESPTPDSSIRPSTIFPDFDGVGCANIRDEKNDQVYEDGRSSPLKRWLRTLRKRQVAQPEMLRSPHERWIMDDFDPVPLLIPSRLGRGELGHRKTLSSASSSALLSAVKTASVTLSSLSRYPRSRQSGRNSCIRLNNSPAGENYGRDSLENVLDNTPAIDAGIWYRSIQRNRIFEEIITSEESYIRDLKTFLNVPHLSLVLVTAKSIYRSTSRFFHGKTMIVKQFTDQSQRFCNYMKNFSHIFIPFETIMITTLKSSKGTTVQSPSISDGAV